MGGGEALKVAIDLLHVPSRVRVIRSDPLPDGLLMLLRIAAGDSEAEFEATEHTTRPLATVRESAAFFIEQILLDPGADNYRVLGASPEATNGELRRNMLLLLKWLHPDMDCEGQRSVFAARVTSAWDELKTIERRAAYDEARRLSRNNKSARRVKRGGRATSAKPASKKPRAAGRDTAESADLDGHSKSFNVERAGLLRRALLFLFGRRSP